MCFETGHSGELLVTYRTGRVLPIVGTLMKGQVEFNVKRLGALVTSMWLLGEKSQEAPERQSFHSERHSNMNKNHSLPFLQALGRLSWTPSQ